MVNYIQRGIEYLRGCYYSERAERRQEEPILRTSQLLGLEKLVEEAKLRAFRFSPTYQPCRGCRQY